MNHSIVTCGRTTHLKIVAVALIMDSRPGSTSPAPDI